MTRRVALASALVLALAAPAPARADGYLDEWHPYQTYWAVAWQAAFPASTLRDAWVGEPGWIGGEVAFRVGVVQRLALGVSANWTWLSGTTPFVTVERPETTITGPAYRRVQLFTLLGSLHWYATQGNVQPWVGVGVGVAWYDTFIQSVDLKQKGNGSALAVVPEAGLLFTLQQRFGFYVSGSYHWTQASFYGVKDAQWISAQVGGAFYF